MTIPDLSELGVGILVIEPEALRTRIDEGEASTVFNSHIPLEHGDRRISGENVSHVSIPHFEFFDEELDEPLFGRLPENGEFVILCMKDHSSEYVVGLFIQGGYDAVALGHSMSDWASIYEYTELRADGDAFVAQYQRPSSDCLIYPVVNGGEAAIVDPFHYLADEYAADTRMLGAELTYAIDTYVHTDHISGIRTLVKGHGATDIILKTAEIRSVDHDTSYGAITGGEAFTVGDTDTGTIHTPGHTTGMTTYAVDNILFMGNDLFTESVARPNLGDGGESTPDAAGMLYGPLQERVPSRDDDIIVASVHFNDAAISAGNGNYTATSGELKEAMSALPTPKDELVEFIPSDMLSRPASYVDIIETSLGVQEPNDGHVFESELGPNSCTASNEALMS